MALYNYDPYGDQGGTVGTVPSLADLNAPGVLGNARLFATATEDPGAPGTGGGGGPVVPAPPGSPPTTPNWQRPVGTPPGSYPGAIFDPNWSNPAGSTAASSSSRAPRLVNRGGQWYLTEHGGERGPLQPNELADAQAYVQDFWMKYPTGFIPGVGPQRNEDYRPLVSTTSTGTTTNVGTGNRTVGGGNIGNLQGWDAGKFADANVQSLKYRAGRILSDYPTTSDGIKQAMQDPRWTSDPDLSKATFDGKDAINFNGVLSEGGTGTPVYAVDVLAKARQDANGVWVSAEPFWWGDQNAMFGTTGAGGNNTGVQSNVSTDRSAVQGARSGEGLTANNITPLSELEDPNRALQFARDVGLTMPPMNPRAYNQLVQPIADLNQPRRV